MIATVTARQAERDVSGFVFDRVSWDDYEAMLRIVGNRPIRVTYDRGRMEIISPLFRHGAPAFLLGAMVAVLVEELDIRFEGADPVTFRRRDLEKGIEPDKCFYFGQNAARVCGKRAGLDPKRVERVLDFYHAAHHVSLALQALGLPEAQRTATYRTLRHQLRAGWSREVVAALRRMAQAQPVHSGVWVEIEYLEKHEAHPRYDWFRYRGHPLSRGAVESAIRRVVNLRLKGNGTYWREENDEGTLVLRAAALTGRWQETMDGAQAAMAVDRRRAWDWEAPDIVVELKSSVAIKPPEAQPQPSERERTIAAGLLSGTCPLAPGSLFGGGLLAFLTGHESVLIQVRDHIRRFAVTLHQDTAVEICRRA